jgi:hypothetical protein
MSKKLVRDVLKTFPHTDKEIVEHIVNDKHNVVHGIIEDQGALCGNNVSFILAVIGSDNYMAINDAIWTARHELGKDDDE